jgi:hypothetical protein
MWDIFPSKIKLSVSILISILVFSLFFYILEYGLVRAVSTTISFIAVLALVVGKYLWTYVYIDFFKKHFCPDLNGNWVAKIKSNFNGGMVVEIPISIKADLFSIKMFATTSFGQSNANYCRIYRNNNDLFQLEYLFKVDNDSAISGDTTFYEGAARLTLHDHKSMVWKGVYWTNRCWNEGKNTAGEIEISRV